MGQLSDTARLYWPFLYCVSNGYGRFEIDYLTILERAFVNFRDKPSEELLRSLLREYRDANLLFVYRVDNSVWGAWDSNSGQQWFNNDDKASPAPPEPQFTAWKAKYRAHKNGVVAPTGSLGKSLLSEDPPTIDAENPAFQTRSSLNSLTQDNTSTTQAQDKDKDKDKEQGPAKAIPKNYAALTLTQRGLFDRFWAVYWRKVGKDAAVPSFFRRVSTEQDLAVVLAAIEAQTPEMRGRDPTHIPYPATWLNRGSMFDEAIQPGHGLIVLRKTHDRREQALEEFDERMREKLAHGT